MAALLWATSLQAGQLVPSNARASRPNAFGGRSYYLRQGGFSRSELNSFGGYNYYDSHGRMNMRTMPYRDGYELYHRYGR